MAVIAENMSLRSSREIALSLSMLQPRMIQWKLICMAEHRFKQISYLWFAYTAKLLFHSINDRL